MTTPSTDPGEPSTGAPADPVASAPRAGGRARALLRNTGWQTASQVVPLVVNIVLTPYVMAGLGLRAYGIFLVVNTLTAFLTALDGGIGRATERYFILDAGRGDKESMTRLLTSLLGVVSLGSLVLFVVGFTTAPWLVRFFHAPPALFDGALFLLRTMVVIVALIVVRQLFTSVLFAHHQFWVSTVAYLGGHVIYTIGLVVTVETGASLPGIAYTFMAQQAFATLAIVPAALRHLVRSGVGFVSRSRFVEFCSYAWKAQTSGLVALVGLQAHTLIVGRARPDEVASFGPGVTFASQLRWMPMNAVIPMQTLLGHAIGEKGVDGAEPDFARVQRVWVKLVTGWVAVGAPAAYFGVNAWLPIDGDLAGRTAGLLLLAHLFALLPVVLSLWCQLLGHPGVDMWSSFWGLVLNLAVTFALIVPLGAMGTVAGALVGQALSLVLLLRLSRAALGRPTASPLASVPWALALVCAAGSALGAGLAGHLIAQAILPGGALGLLACGVGAAPALLLFVWRAVGLAQFLQLVTAGRRGSPTGKDVTA